jgi:hypothetical protein
MNAGNLHMAWSSRLNVIRAFKVFVGPRMDQIEDADFHAAVGVYRDEIGHEIIVQYAEDSQKLSDKLSAVGGLTGEGFLAKLRLAMQGNTDWPIDASDQGHKDNSIIRIDFPIGVAGSIDEREVLLLLW